MMMQDFLLLEHYFGELDAIQYEDQLIQRYGVEPIHKALAEGWLIRKRLFCKNCWIYMLNKETEFENV